jgi:subtilase family serine protease
MNCGGLTATGRLPATNQLRLAIGLPLRDPAGLDTFLAQVYDPASPVLHEFLTPAELTKRFGPTEQDYEAVKTFARTNGLVITATHANRLVLDVVGPAAAVQTNLTGSLTATASNLAVGTYMANLTFSNWTSQVAQAGLFTLQVNQPLVVSPTNGFAALGPVGGPFSVTSQNYSLTNQGGSALPLGIINASSWLSASPSSGTLAGSAQTTMTVSLTAAADSLGSGIYAANVLVTNPTGVAASLPFTIKVGQSIVNNGGFEAGNFSGWTLSASSK